MLPTPKRATSRSRGAADPHALHREVVRDLLELIVGLEAGATDPRIAGRVAAVVEAIRNRVRRPLQPVEHAASVALADDIGGLYKALLAGRFEQVERPAPVPGRTPASWPISRRWPGLHGAIRSAVARHWPESANDDLEWLELDPGKLREIARDGNSRTAAHVAAARSDVADIVGCDPSVIRTRSAARERSVPRRLDGSLQSGRDHLAITLEALGQSRASSAVLATIVCALAPLAASLDDEPEGRARLLSALSKAIDGSSEIELDAARALATAADVHPIECALDALRRRLPYLSASISVANPFDELDPAEQACSTGMTGQRREEFAAGRSAARRALRAAGHLRGSVVAGDDSVPIFPEGYVGSIAHKHGRAVAAVAHSTSVRSIGIDLEFDEDHDEEALQSEVVTEREKPLLTVLRLAQADLISPATLVLSAKEALYKAVFPIGRTRFDFDEVELTFQPAKRTFRARRFPGREGLTIHGAYELAGRWLVAVAVV